MKRPDREIIGHLSGRKDYFGDLSDRLSTFAFCYNLDGMQNVKFPPNQMAVSGLRRCYEDILARASNVANADSGTVSEESVDMETEFFYLTMPISDIAKAVIENIQQLTIDDFGSLLTLGEHCSRMERLYARCIRHIENKNILADWLTLDELAITTIEKAHLILGYWTAKSEQKKRGISGGEKRTNNKNANVDIVAQLRKKYPDYKHDKKQKRLLKNEAMHETGITSDKTIENYLAVFDKKGKK